MQIGSRYWWLLTSFLVHRHPWQWTMHLFKGWSTTSLLAAGTMLDSKAPDTFNCTPTFWKPFLAMGLAHFDWQGILLETGSCSLTWRASLSKRCFGCTHAIPHPVTLLGTWVLSPVLGLQAQATATASNHTHTHIEVYITAMHWSLTQFMPATNNIGGCLNHFRRYPYFKTEYLGQHAVLCTSEVRTMFGSACLQSWLLGTYSIYMAWICCESKLYLEAAKKKKWSVTGSPWFKVLVAVCLFSSLVGSITAAVGSFREATWLTLSSAGFACSWLLWWSC